MGYRKLVSIPKLAIFIILFDGGRMNILTCAHSDVRGEDWPDGGGIEICKKCGMSRYVWEQGEGNWIMIEDIEKARKEVQESLDQLGSRNRDIFEVAREEGTKKERERCLKICDVVLTGHRLTTCNITKLKSVEDSIQEIKRKIEEEVK